MGLFEPIWMTKNISKIKKAKDEIFNTDPNRFPLVYGAQAAIKAKKNK